MDWSASQRQRLHALFGVFFGPEITGSILSLLRPALRIGESHDLARTAAAGVLSPTAARVGATTRARSVAVRPEIAGSTPVHLAETRLGGMAKLPASVSWPRWDGRPLDFLAVFDFAELATVHAVPGLPTSGTVAFFCASRPPLPWGDEPGDEGGRRVLARATVPAEPPEGVAVHPPLQLSATPFLSLPGPGEPALGALAAAYSGILETYQQLYEAWAEHVWGDTPMHQIGGWPVPVREPLRRGEDTLLLQLDADDRLGWQWGDAGRAYFTVAPGDPVDEARLTLRAR